MADGMQGFGALIKS